MSSAANAAESEPARWALAGVAAADPLKQFRQRTSPGMTPAATSCESHSLQPLAVSAITPALAAARSTSLLLDSRRDRGCSMPPVTRVCCTWRALGYRGSAAAPGGAQGKSAC